MRGARSNGGGYATPRRALLLLAVSVLLAPLLAAAPAGAQTPGPFVRTNGTHLTLDGKAWYLYGGATYGTSNPGGPQPIQDEIALAQAGGLNTLRIVNMFDESGVDPNAPTDTASWEHVDEILAAMQTAGLHAILDLSAFRNHLQNRELLVRGTAALAASYPVPGPCAGLPSDDRTRCVGASWCEANLGACTDPYSSGLANTWSSFLQFVATRTNTVTGVAYRDDPTIAIVSFAGEPNPPNSQEPLRPGTQELTAFYSRVFGQWKSVDPHHLVTSGGLLHIDWQALYGSDSGIDTDAIFALQNQDVLSIHNYFAHLPASPANDTKTAIVAAAAQDLNKPWITEEFGFPQTPVEGATSYAESDRADWFRTIYETQQSPPQGAPSAGVAFWNLGPEVAGASHDVNPGTPATWAVVQQYSPAPHPFHTFVVNVDTSVGDPTPDGSCDDGAGGCSIREAIQEADAAPGLDEIAFAVPSAAPSGAVSIGLTTELPAITDPVIIDGRSQPGTTTPNVEIDGSATPSGSRGLVLDAGAAGSTLDALVLGGFDQAGIEIHSADTTVTGNFLGTDITGTQAHANGIGLLIDDAVDVAVGGYASGSGNVISANTAQGIRIMGTTTMFTSIRGNRIGTDVAGTAPLGNGSQGIWSTAEGVDLGANFAGEPIGVTPGGACTGACNVISANGAPAGVELQAHSIVRGNFIGTDVTGTQDLGNAEAGVVGHNTTFVGGLTPEGRNVISGNDLVGVRFTDSQNFLSGSFVGTDTTGLVALPNGHGSPASAGVELCCSTRITNVGDSGSFPGGRNVISGNDGVGLLIRGANTTSNFVEINEIGVGSDGVTPVPNDVGVRLDGGARVNTIGELVSYPFISNVIASNTGDGLQIANAHDNRIWSNRIAANGGYGVLVDGGTSNLIGGNGQYVGGDNTVEGNGLDGIAVLTGTDNSIFRNAVSGNGGLGIDLAGDGVTPNDPSDADTGPNDRQNFPELTSAASGGGTTQVRGTLEGQPSSPYLIEFFSNPSCDPSGHGEGALYLGSRSVTLAGSGASTFSATLGIEVAVGDVVTATATRGGVVDEHIPLRSTSEFSACEPVVPMPPSIGIAGVTPVATSVGRYDLFEASFDLDRAYANPFDPNQIGVDVTFISPTGVISTVPAFWYQDYSTSANGGGDELYTPAGSPHWRVRFAPSEVGVYTYTIDAQDPTATGSAGPMAFTATSSSNPGFVGLDPGDTRYLRYDDGAPYLPRGENAAFEDRPPFQGGMLTYGPLFDSFAAAHENWTRVWMSDFNRAAIEWSGNHWSGLYGGIGVYSLASAWRWDMLLQRAGADGLEVQVVLNDHGQFSSPGSNPRWDENPYNAANGGPVPSAHPEEFFTNQAAKDLYKQRLRYIVARWGAYPSVLAWELFNELQFLGSAASNPLNDPQMAADVQAWHIEMATYLKSIDPFQHLVTTSSDAPGLTDPIWSDPHFDLVQVHDYGGPPMSRFAQTIDDLRTTYHKPVIYGEFGLNGSPEAGFDPTTFAGSTQDKHHLQQATHVRNAAWAATLSGSGAMSWWWGIYLAADPTAHRTGPDFPANEQIFPALDAYVGDLDIVGLGLHPSQMTPSNGLFAVGMNNTTRAFAWIQDVDSEYGSGVDPANAIVTGGTLDIDGMQEGDYAVDVYTTRGSGGVQSSFVASASGGTLHLDLPTVAGDLAVKVRPGPPRSPTGVVAAGGDGRATVTWIPPITGAPGSISGFTLLPRDVTLGTDLAAIPVSGTDATVVGLTNGHTYTFTVTAANPVGSSTPSAPSGEVTPQAGAPDPVVVTEPVDPGGGTVSSGGSPTSTRPVTTGVEVPAGAGGGTVTIAQGTVSQDPPVGWQFLGTQIHIDSTATTTPGNPLRITFALDDAALAGETPQTVQVFRTEGLGAPTLVPDCLADPTTIASPDPCIPRSSRQPLPGGVGATFTVVTSSASEWNIATLAPVAVSVTNAGLAPRAQRPILGQRIRWTFSSTKLHSVTESIGLGAARAPLFDSGLRTAGALTYRFVAAGTYTYRSTNKKDGASFTGTATVPMTASPVTGTRTSSYTLTWSSASLAGYAFDVQMRFRKAGSSKWSAWTSLQSNAQPGRTFVPSKGAGTYAFHARLRNVATKRASGWSPDVTITARP